MLFEMTGSQPMNIGDASRLAGLPVKTIRYYEDAGLIKPRRQQNGYRYYEERSVHRLQFLGRARALGFSISDCRRLLALYDDAAHDKGGVRAIAARRLADIESRIENLRSLKRLLAELVSRCANETDDGCSILEYLESGASH